MLLPRWPRDSVHDDTAAPRTRHPTPIVPSRRQRRHDGYAQVAYVVTAQASRASCWPNWTSASFTNVPGGRRTSSTPTRRGPSNYNDASDRCHRDRKAIAAVNVDGYTGVYDGNAARRHRHRQGRRRQGAGRLDLGASFTNVPGGTASWTFTDVTGNYNNATDTVAIVISKANATVNVDGYTGVYDGNAHGATGTAKGVDGRVLAGLDLGASFTNVPGGTAHWTFTDATGNYNNATAPRPSSSARPNDGQRQRLHLHRQ